MAEKPTYGELEQRVKELEKEAYELKRKRTEEALQESEEKHRLFFENSPIGIIHYDNQGIITDVNEATITAFGSSREELIGLDIGDIPDKMFVNEVYKSLNGELGYYEGEYASYTGGKTSIIKANWIPIFRDGNVIAGVGIVEDITERKQAEDLLRKSEERYRTVLEANPDPVVVYDIEGKVIYFNPAFTRTLGWALEERIGKKMDVFVPEEAWQDTKVMIDKVLAGESFSGIETRRFTKEGKIVPVSISGAVYKGRDNKPVGSIINLRDISEQKTMENQLQQAQRMESLGTLAGGIAHDFNNLLMGIQGRNSLMLMDATSFHPHFEHLKGIEEYIQSAADLTKQLLGFAMGGKYEVKPTDLNELIKNQNRMFGRTQKEINIREKYKKNLWAAEVDQGQLEQVLLNLYVNAWQAMPDGGNIDVQTENIIIDENYIKPFAVKLGNYVRISVTDTGVGMDEETQLRIFDPFFTTKEIGRGTGLGLASGYGIIKNHGGFIDVKSVKGEGTTFNIYLPASGKEAIEETELSKDVLKGSETVLLVDDEDMIIDVGRSMLEKIGYKTMIARSGKDAIEIYKKKEKHIDIVVLDMIMPEMGGGNTYDKLKKINSKIKVLLSSGYSVNGQAKEILDRGCNGFIQKPFNMNDLSQKLRTILDRDQ